MTKSFKISLGSAVMQRWVNYMSVFLEISCMLVSIY